MDFNQVKELLNLVDQSSLKEFQIKMDNATIQMSKNSTSSPMTVATDGPVGTQERTVSVVDNSHYSPENTGQPASSEAPIETIPAAEGEVILSPIVGVVYLAPEPGEPAFKKAGDTVKIGETICIVEAMKVMNEIKSEQDGVIAEVLVEDSQVVEYNQPLFRIV